MSPRPKTKRVALWAADVVHLMERLRWPLVDQVVVSGATFLTNLLAARWLGIDGFGEFALVWLLVQFAQSMQTALVTSPMMTIAVKLPQPYRTAYYSSMWGWQLLLILCISALVSIGYLAAWLLYKADPYVILPVICLIFGTQIQDFLRRYSYTGGEVLIPLAIDILRYVLQVVILVLCTIGVVPVGATPTNVLWVCAISIAASVSVFSRVAPALLWSRPGLITAWERNFSFARWQFASAILQWSSSNLIVILSGSMLGPAVVGALRVGQSLLGLTQLLFQSTDNILPPLAAQALAEKGIEGLRRVLLPLATTFILISLSLFAVASVDPSFWIASIFGETYKGYGYVLMGYATVYIMMSMVVPLRYCLAAMEDSRAIFWGYLASALVGATVGVPLISGWGAVGAMVGICASQLAMLITLGSVAYCRFAFRSRS